MKRADSANRVVLMGIGVAAMVTALTVASANAAVIAYWNMDETTGDTAFDSSPNNHDGTLRFGAAWDPAGHSNGAVALDSVAEYVRVPSASDLKYAGGNMTLSTWVYLNATETDGGYVISKPWHGWGGYNYRIHLTGNTTTLVIPPRRSAFAWRHRGYRRLSRGGRKPHSIKRSPLPFHPSRKPGIISWEWWTPRRI